MLRLVLIAFVRAIWLVTRSRVKSCAGAAELGGRRRRGAVGLTQPRRSVGLSVCLSAVCWRRLGPPHRALRGRQSALSLTNRLCDMAPAAAAAGVNAQGKCACRAQRQTCGHEPERRCSGQDVTSEFCNCIPATLLIRATAAVEESARRKESSIFFLAAESTSTPYHQRHPCYRWYPLGGCDILWWVSATGWSGQCLLKVAGSADRRAVQNSHLVRRPFGAEAASNSPGSMHGSVSPVLHMCRSPATGQVHLAGSCSFGWTQCDTSERTSRRCIRLACGRTLTSSFRLHTICSYISTHCHRAGSVKSTSSRDQHLYIDQLASRHPHQHDERDTSLGEVRTIGLLPSRR